MYPAASTFNQSTPEPPAGDDLRFLYEQGPAPRRRSALGAPRAASFYLDLEVGSWEQDLRPALPQWTGHRNTALPRPSGNARPAAGEDGGAAGRHDADRTARR